MTLQDWKRTQSTACHGIRTRMVQCRWEAMSATVYPLWHPCTLVLHMTTPHWVVCTRSLTDCVYITLHFTVDILFYYCMLCEYCICKNHSYLMHVNGVWGGGGYSNNIAASISMHKYIHGVWSAPIQEVGSRSSPGPHPVTSLKQLPHDPLLPASSVTTLLLCGVPQWVPTLMSSTWSTSPVCRSSQSLLTTWASYSVRKNIPGHQTAYLSKQRYLCYWLI